MLRKLAIFAVLAVVLTAAFASAAGLIVNGGAVQVGEDVTYCDTNGVDVSWGLEVDDDLVYFVRVTGIDSACVGNEMFIKVYDASDTDIAYVHGVIDDTVPGQFKASFSSPLDTEDIVSVRIWIEGPNN